MPAIWSSSERPISVRTIWVDGIRHAILSPDDPLIHSESRRRSRISRNKTYSTEYQQLESRLDRLNSCFTNLQMVVKKNLSETKTTSSPMYRKLSAPPCSRISTSISDNSIIESLLNDNKKIKKKYGCYKVVKENSNFIIDNHLFKNNIDREKTSESEPNFKLNITECRNIEETSDVFWNPLFERVLQWLDFSGRTQNFMNDFEDHPTEKIIDEEKQKWSLTKRRMPHLKCDYFEEKERITMRNYKLRKKSNLENFKREENKITQSQFLKIKNTKEEIQEFNETLNSGETFIKSNEEELENRMKEKVSSTIISSPGRLKLHIVIPNLAYKENMSSQESLIDDQK